MSKGQRSRSLESTKINHVGFLLGSWLVLSAACSGCTTRCLSSDRTLHGKGLTQH